MVKDNKYITPLDIKFDKCKLLEEFMHVQDTKQPINLGLIKNIKQTYNRHNESNGDSIEEGNPWWETQETWSGCKPFRNEDECPGDESRRIFSLFRNVFEDHEYSIVFLHQEKNSEVLPHRDVGPKAAINFIVSEDHAPIHYKDFGSISYECALLNLSEIHSVPKFPNERTLLKLRLSNLDYYETKKLLQQHNMI